MSGYEAVMQVAAREDGQFWLSVTRGFHTYVTSHGRQEGKAPDEIEFSFEHTPRAKLLRWLRRSPKEDAVAQLMPLLDAGVIARVGDAPDDGSSSFFHLRDPDGVGRALDELHVDQL